MGFKLINNIQSSDLIINELKAVPLVHSSVFLSEEEHSEKGSRLPKYNRLPKRN